MDSISSAGAHHLPCLDFQYAGQEDSCTEIPVKSEVNDDAAAARRGLTKLPKQNGTDFMFYPEDYDQRVLDGDISCKVWEDEDREMVSDSCRNEVHQKVTKSTLNSSRDPAGYEIIGALERNGAQAQTLEDVDQGFENKSPNTDLTSHHPGMSSNYQPSAVHPVVPLTAPVARVASSLAHPLSTAMPRVVSAAHAAAAVLAQRQQQAMMTHMMRQRYIRPVLLPGRLLPVQGSRPAVR